MTTTGVIILVHGSRGKVGKVEVEETLARIVTGLRSRFPPGTEVTGAALQFNEPTLEQAVDLLASRGTTRIVILPYFLFAGRHIKEHVPQELADLKPLYPSIQFVIADVMGMDDSFISLMARRAGRTTPDLLQMPAGTKGISIESESMQIVESLLPAALNVPHEEREVIKRIVHAGGDAGLAGLVSFSPGAVLKGIEAISRGCPIFTDVRMALAGIDIRLAAHFGCEAACAMDVADAAGLHAEEGKTMAAAAVEGLGNRINGAVVAIGNAPTALLSLLSLIDNRKVLPALVIGMPVGFVKAKESKDELMRRSVPSITVAGTRGGSPLAAAAVNSLLRLARDKYGN